MKDKINSLIADLEKMREEYMAGYDETGDTQTQGVSLGIDEAIKQIKIKLK